MRYKMLKELPFIKQGEIFEKGGWVGGGWGVNLGYQGDNKLKAHNGIKTFEQHENKLLDSLLLNAKWVKMIPESVIEVLNLYEEGYFKKHETIELLCLKD